MGKIFRYIVGTALLTAIPQSAFAYAHCIGPIYELMMRKDGSVLVNNGFGLFTVCSLSVDYNMASPNNTGPITPSSCQGLYSMMLSIKLSNAELDVIVNDTTCTGLVSSGGALLKPLVFYKIVT